MGKNRSLIKAVRIYIPFGYLFSLVILVVGFVGKVIYIGGLNLLYDYEDY